MRRKYSLAQTLRQTEEDFQAILGMPGVAKDGSIALDYLEAGRDPALPRKTSKEILARLEEIRHEKA